MSFFSGFGGGFPFGGMGGSHQEDDCNFQVIQQRSQEKSITTNSIKSWNSQKLQLMKKLKNSIRNWPKNIILIAKVEILKKYFIFDLVQSNS